MGTPTGDGMDLPAGCHGVPVLCRGAGSSAVIWKAVSCRSFLSVRTVRNGFRRKGKDENYLSIVLFKTATEVW